MLAFAICLVLCEIGMVGFMWGLRGDAGNLGEIGGYFDVDGRFSG